MEENQSEKTAKPEKWPVFLCYRRDDGSDEARWLFETLHGQRLPFTSETQPPAIVDLYYDQNAAAVDDWTKVHRPALERARAFIFVATPGAYAKRDSDDWVHRELNWWLKNRREPMIIVDATGKGTRWLPKRIQRRWPNAQRIVLRVRELDKRSSDLQETERTATAQRILKGICSTAERIVYEDLEKSKRLTRRLGVLSVVAVILVLAFIPVSIAAWRNATEAIRQKEVAQARLLDQYEEQGRLELLRGRPSRALLYLDRVYQARPASTVIRFLVAQAATQSADAQVATLIGHSAPVLSVVFSPDGSRIATASVDKTARLWDALTGKPLFTFAGHSDAVYLASFSPDGTRLATTSWDRTVRLWDTRSGSLLNVLRGHSDEVYSTAFSPDGTRLATGSRDQKARLWDAHSGKLLMSLEHPSLVLSTLFSPNGTRLATPSFDSTTRIWDANSGKLLTTLDGNQAGPVTGAAFSPDGKRLAIAHPDGTARLWDVDSGARVAVLEGHFSSINSVAFSPDGRSVATASSDKTVRLWDVRSGTRLAVLEGHPGGVGSAEYSPDGSRIATLSSDESARLWDANSGTFLATLEGHSRTVSSAAFSPDGSRFVTASYDGTARLWDPRGGLLVATARGDFQYDQSATFSRDGECFATIGGYRTINLWDTSSGKLRATFKVTDGATSVAFSPNGAQLAKTSWNDPPQILDARSGNLTATLRGHQGRVSSVVFSHDGTRVATTGDDKMARLWDTSNGALLATLRSHLDAVTFAAFSPDDRRLATASRDKSVRLWDARSGVLLAVLGGHTDGVYSVVGLIRFCGHQPRGGYGVEDGAEEAATSA